MRLVFLTSGALPSGRTAAFAALPVAQMPSLLSHHVWACHRFKTALISGKECAPVCFSSSAGVGKVFGKGGVKEKPDHELFGGEARDESS